MTDSTHEAVQVGHFCLYPSPLDHLKSLGDCSDGTELSVCTTCGRLWSNDDMGRLMPLCSSCGENEYECAGADGGECQRVSSGVVGR